MAIDTQYVAWNYVIGKYFFGPERIGQTVFLAMDEHTLWKIGHEGGNRSGG